MKQIKDISGFEDLVITEENQDSEIESNVGNFKTGIMSEPEHMDSDLWWDKFEAAINATDSCEKRPRVFCRLDCELAYTLDECKIRGASRTDMVNAIVRIFITEHLEQFKANRKSKKTLL